MVELFDAKLRTAGQGTLLPSYHVLVPEKSDYLYCSVVRDFETQAEVIHGVSNASCAADVHLTFDDAHSSQFRFGFPLLQKYRLTALFFAISGWVGRSPEYMNWQQLRELSEAGHQVQSHSLSHVQLTRCGDTELANEVTRSKNEIQQKLGTAVTSISIPFGRWDRRVIRACRDAGYANVYTSDPIFPGRMIDVNVIGRFMITRKTKLSQLRRILTGHSVALARVATEHRCKSLIRSAVGETLYDEIWGVLRSRKSLLEAAREYRG